MEGLSGAGTGAGAEAEAGLRKAGLGLGRLKCVCVCDKLHYESHSGSEARRGKARQGEARQGKAGPEIRLSLSFCNQICAPLDPNHTYSHTRMESIPITREFLSFLALSRPLMQRVGASSPSWLNCNSFIRFRPDSHSVARSDCPQHKKAASTSDTTQRVADERGDNDRARDTHACSQ